MSDGNATRMRLRSDETESMFALFAGLQELEKAMASMERRLRSIPNGWRDIRMLWSVQTKLIDKLMLTVPPEKLSSLKRNLRHMCYRIYMYHPVDVPDDEVVVADDDLKALTEYAHGYACLACENNCNTCKLGKALDHVMIQTRKYDERWSWIDCETDYTDAQAIPVKDGDA